MRGAALVARFPALLERQPRRPPAAGRLLVVRPDGYVGLTAPAHTWDEVETYLRRIEGVTDLTGGCRRIGTRSA
ncbi:hypothetical protein [Roseomonas indoligenes]|uniref:hypothetical protein n=1 Tax=Roseomonas indoligenes TaxID=2820811 RepID=UPI0031582019